MIRVPDYVASIMPYQPGKPLEELERELGITGSIKLASNENPLGPSKKAVAAIKRHLAELNRYPDGGGFYLKRALSERLGVKDSELILGNGSNELLDIAVRTFMKPGDEAVMAAPSFVVYSMAVRSVGGRPIEVPCVSFRHDLAAMAHAVTERTRMIFIANPNNPTGTINTREEFDSFMAQVPEDIVVVLDEAYYEYVDNAAYADSMAHFRAGRNVVILRTFSKIYGLAGLRIGYGIASAEILEEMNRIREPFNTNTLGQVAALAALDDKAHLEKTRKVNAQGRKFLYRELKKLKLKFVPCETNFIFIPVTFDPRALYDALLRKGVIIRPAGPQAIRITIGTMPENKRMIAALAEVLPTIIGGK